MDKKNARTSTPKIPNITQNEAYRGAEYWLSNGAAIVPLEPRSKKPFNGYSSRKYIKKKKELKKFFRKYPDANYGIVTGSASGIIVLDVDGKEGRDSLKALKKANEGFSSTVIVETGRGRHYYFKGDDWFRNSAGKLGAGLDVRGDGGYVVGPGSVHESGVRYKYRAGSSPDEVSVANSSWLRERVASLVQLKADSVSTPTLVKEGGRNNALIAYLGGLVRKGIVGDELLALARIFNGSFPSPLDDDEVVKTVKSALTYSPVDRDADPGEAYADAVLQTYFGGGKHLMRLDDGLFWAYDAKKWTIENVDSLKQKTLKVIQQNPQRPGMATTTVINQVVDILKAKVMRDGDPLRFTDPPAAALNLRNGELWLASDGATKLGAHNAESYLRHFLDIEYDSNAACPLFDRAMEEIFPAEHAEIIPYMVSANFPAPFAVECSDA
ncbi:bifunctional DNA primase/polymerase [Sinorhizobium mexicanum]|nr:bifunctional DNA primase/polymerase [Sinorhizobium mexicanum]MBP1887718.1 hypothetical protein [Sinorhizobium mexicanum]